MDYKEMYNILSNMAQADKIKNSLEDLYLFLHEIENMMQNNEENTEISDNHDEFSYKLQIIEQQIKKIDELLQEENNNINYNEYMS
ncbi:hypothetical protein [Mucispirillum schaedleri]|jgi:DNA-binding transcriptional MerR regulator|uniref:Uncharacterized protein n=1 Tax=Mucispirillum schaedleri ASF457 TaxID=1379858 RepID=V2PYI6_9BACT|nr:hypothetical protein [Mucispirillum schaedleri]MCX4359858.1 hypothetical protein [Mucispirillum schaedleri]USF23404.1 hypothetical protein N508_000463 [Mucispirillum schaedleri ASF457]SIW05264.1 conserved hypothetical protein [Mucispirillum schaedleri ASF457]